MLNCVHFFLSERDNLAKSKHREHGANRERERDRERLNSVDIFFGI